jgi:hypothetical protein
MCSKRRFSSCRRQKPPVIVTRPRPQPRSQPKPQPKSQRQPAEYRYEDDDYEDDPNAIYDDPGAPNWGNPEDDIDLILGYNDNRTNRITRKIAKKLRDAEDRRKDRELTRAMRNLTLDEDQMDINAARFEDVRLVPDDEGGFRILPARMLKKK